MHDDTGNTAGADPPKEPQFEPVRTPYPRHRSGHPHAHAVHALDAGVDLLWTLSQKFSYMEALTDFLVRTHTVENRAIIKKLERAGKIKAVLVSGIFTRNTEARLDMFVVGDNIKTASMDRIVKSIEADMGKDIRYAVLSAPDFAYRKSMNDKLVRDVLDFPHRVLVDRIGISLQ